MDQVLLWQIGIGAAAFFVGLLGGLALRRPDRRLKTQVEELEAQLHESRREADQHRARVEKHFERTSELFGDMTEQYTALYAHLADGARELCSEGGPALGRGLNDPLLAATFGGDAPWKGQSATDAPEAEAAPQLLESETGSDPVDASADDVSEEDATPAKPEGAAS